MPAAPAKIPEFHLTVKDDEWKVARNRAPPCAHKKQAALFTTIKTLPRQGIIRKSTSPHYSQVLLVPKPDNTFRMCVDYRALNDCTPDASWPIPNIAEMLRRIGSRKPKFLVPWTLHKDIIKLLLVTQQKHTRHLLPSLGYMSSHDSPMDQNAHHRTFR